MDRNNHGSNFHSLFGAVFKVMCVPPSPKGVSSQCALLWYEYWLNDEY